MKNFQISKGKNLEKWRLSIVQPTTVGRTKDKLKAKRAKLKAAEVSGFAKRVKSAVGKEMDAQEIQMIMQQKPILCQILKMEQAFPK